MSAPLGPSESVDDVPPAPRDDETLILEPLRLSPTGAPDHPSVDDLVLELVAYFHSLTPPPALRGAPPSVAAGATVRVEDGWLVVDTGIYLCAWHIPSSPRGFSLLDVLDMAAVLRVPVAWLAGEMRRAGGGEVGVWVELVCRVLGE